MLNPDPNPQDPNFLDPIDLGPIKKQGLDLGLAGPIMQKYGNGCGCGNRYDTTITG